MPFSVAIEPTKHVQKRCTVHLKSEMLSTGLIPHVIHMTNYPDCWRSTCGPSDPSGAAKGELGRYLGFMRGGDFAAAQFGPFERV
jgi:hypothetical protein